MMFIRVPVENLIKTQDAAINQLEPDIPGKGIWQHQDPVVQETLAKLTDGILIITEERKVVFANDCAGRILRQINQSRDRTEEIPKEMRFLCDSLAEIRRQFPGQHWMLTNKICISSAVTFNVQARYMKLETLGKYCFVLMLRDQYQLIKTIAEEEARKFNLTDRETEIWLLQRANYTYKQIASELFIAPNTVKKHMQNIHLKQKGTDGTMN